MQVKLVFIGLDNITLIFHIGLILNINSQTCIKRPPEERQNMVSSYKWSLNRGPV